ncbi:MAG TPA: hypothetical protein PKE47_00560 [Verrucomicrobiota bacterium]|nr:hypothetical protein [Verrucomicrobiota bacterium]
MQPWPASRTAVTRRVRALRPLLTAAAAPRAHVVRESERGPDGRLAGGAVLFLVNRECPWHCVMCDLWRHTAPRPAEAISGQIARLLAELAGAVPRQLKLYNAGSFFDLGAVPREDWPEIARLVAGAERVIVESHPRLIGPAVPAFRDQLAAAAAGPAPRLEVALGLETANPATLARLNKGMTLDDFRRAAALLRRNGVDVRAFALIQPPFEPPEAAVPSAVESVAFAARHGAQVVSLIPARGGNGALEALAAAGLFAPPALTTIERALAAVLVHASPGLRVFVDTWDLERFAACAACLPARRARLERMNHAQRPEPPVPCRACGGSAA